MANCNNCPGFPLDIQTANFSSGPSSLDSKIYTWNYQQHACVPKDPECGDEDFNQSAINQETIFHDVSSCQACIHPISTNKLLDSNQVSMTPESCEMFWSTDPTLGSDCCGRGEQPSLFSESNCEQQGHSTELCPCNCTCCQVYEEPNRQRLECLNRLHQVSTA